MSDAPDERPRTWLPLAAAGVVGAVVVAAAVVSFALGGGPDETEAAVIAACEAEYEATTGPAIVAGEIYDPTRWREHYAVVEEQADVPASLDDLSDDDVAAWDARAAAFEESGAGTMVIVWRLDDDAYAQCAVPVADGTVDAGLAVVGPLEVVRGGADA
ncbi:hypothetical protein [Demequina muriae]|uniref:Uncharacterized protein n=1 Tax=Demequina muriae TaxID=3051664 RepID=A0ABT8GHZ1_9MICO|nr:hypothetical protein [Demequina sp. EGI L300058]MDN4481052.1 hypothetical protein [Demequina sp. EGI L300058]